MIKRIFFTGFLLCMIMQLAHSQGNALIYELKMGFSSDSVRNVTLLSVNLKMRRFETLTSMEISLGSVENAWSLFTKTVSIVKEEGNYYFVADNMKQLMYGSSASFQFIVPNGIPGTCKFARVVGKQLLSDASNILYYQF